MTSLGLVGIDAGDQLAFLRVARRDGPGLDGRLAPIEPQVGLPRGAVGPVAGEAVLRQDRPDVAVVFRLAARPGPRAAEAMSRSNARPTLKAAPPMVDPAG